MSFKTMDDGQVLLYAVSADCWLDLSFPFILLVLVII